MLERLRSQTTARAGGVCIGGPPGGVGGQVTFASSHLTDPACYENVQTPEGLRAQGGGVVVVPWCWEEPGPLLEEGLPHLFLQG